MNHPDNDQLIDFLHGELSPAADAAFHAHLAACDHCRADVDAERALSDALRSEALASELEMPSLVNAAVWARVRAARPGPFARFGAVLRPAFAVPIAAALLIGGWFASPLAHPAGTPPHIDAAYYFAAHAAQSGQSPLTAQGLQTVEATDGDGTVAKASRNSAGPGYLGLAATAAGAFDARQ